MPVLSLTDFISFKTRESPASTPPISPAANGEHPATAAPSETNQTRIATADSAPSQPCLNCKFCTKTAYSSNASGPSSSLQFQGTKHFTVDSGQGPVVRTSLCENCCNTLWKEIEAQGIKELFVRPGTLASGVSSRPLNEENSSEDSGEVERAEAEREGDREGVRFGWVKMSSSYGSGRERVLGV
jgi:hypothetical protein